MVFLAALCGDPNHIAVAGVGQCFATNTTFVANIIMAGGIAAGAATGGAGLWRDTGCRLPIVTEGSALSFAAVAKTRLDTGGI